MPRQKKKEGTTVSVVVGVPLTPKTVKELDEIAAEKLRSRAMQAREFIQSCIRAERQTVTTAK